MATFKRRPSRAEVGRALNQIALLWSRPDKPDPEKGTADTGANPVPAAKQNKPHDKSSIVTAPRLARGAK